MKIGIIGLGSIGQRHAKCLINIGAELSALRSRKGMKKVDLKIKEFDNEEEFFSQELDGVIISNPTHLHAKTMKKYIEKDIFIFVEKPMASSLDEIKGMNKTGKIMVGFNLRYCPLFNYLKENLHILGNIYKAKLYCGQYLPGWHPYADYRQEYYSRKSMGGGALRTLCHEIDLMNYLFGEPKELIASLDHVSDLQIDVEDTAILIAKSNIKYPNMVTLIELDFLDPKMERKGEIFGQNGKIVYYISSSSKARITLVTDKEEKVIWDKEYNWNEMYQNQMRYFLKFIEGEKPKCSFQEGREVMKIIELAEGGMKSSI